MIAIACEISLLSYCFSSVEVSFGGGVPALHITMAIYRLITSLYARAMSTKSIIIHSQIHNQSTSSHNNYTLLFLSYRSPKIFLLYTHHNIIWTHYFSWHDIFKVTRTESFSYYFSTFDYIVSISTTTYISYTCFCMVYFWNLA